MTERLLSVCCIYLVSGGMGAIESRCHPVMGAFCQKIENSNHLVDDVTPPWFASGLLTHILPVPAEYIARKI